MRQRLGWLLAAAVLAAALSAAGAAAAEGDDAAGAIVWDETTGFRWAVSEQETAALRIAGGDPALLRAMVQELQTLRLELQQRIAERLMLQVREQARDRERLGHGGEVAVVAAEHALEVLGVIDPDLAARVRAHLESAGQAAEAKAAKGGGAPGPGEAPGAGKGSSGASKPGKGGAGGGSSGGGGQTGSGGGSGKGGN